MAFQSVQGTIIPAQRPEPNANLDQELANLVNIISRNREVARLERNRQQDLGKREAEIASARAFQRESEAKALENQLAAEKRHEALRQADIGRVGVEGAKQRIRQGMDAASINARNLAAKISQERLQTYDQQIAQSIKGSTPMEVAMAAMFTGGKPDPAMMAEALKKGVITQQQVDARNAIINGMPAEVEKAGNDAVNSYLAQPRVRSIVGRLTPQDQEEFAAAVAATQAPGTAAQAPYQFNPWAGAATPAGPLSAQDFNPPANIAGAEPATWGRENLAPERRGLPFEQLTAQEQDVLGQSMGGQAPAAQDQHLEQMMNAVSEGGKLTGNAIQGAAANILRETSQSRGINSDLASAERDWAEKASDAAKKIAPNDIALQNALSRDILSEVKNQGIQTRSIDPVTGLDTAFELGSYMIPGAGPLLGGMQTRKNVLTRGGSETSADVQAGIGAALAVPRIGNAVFRGAGAILPKIPGYGLVKKGVTSGLNTAGEYLGPAAGWLGEKTGATQLGTDLAEALSKIYTPGERLPMTDNPLAAELRAATAAEHGVGAGQGTMEVPSAYGAYESDLERQLAKSAAEAPMILEPSAQLQLEGRGPRIAPPYRGYIGERPSAAGLSYAERELAKALARKPRAAP